MGRPTVAERRDLEIRVARAEARAELAEHTLETLVEGVTRALGAGTAAALGAIAVVQPPAEPEKGADQITARVRAECEQWGDTPRQRSLNLAFCQDLARQGKTEHEIIKALRRGETVT